MFASPKCQRGGRRAGPFFAWAQKVLQIKDMTAQRQFLTPREASRMLGLTYPTLRRWILAGRIRSIKTPGGHYRVPADGLDGFPSYASARMGSASISGRNQLGGTVLEVTVEGLLARVVLTVGQQHLTAMITADAACELALKPGDQALALFKEMEIIIGKPERDAQGRDPDKIYDYGRFWL